MPIQSLKTLIAGRFSLRNKIILLCCTLSATIALIVGGLYSYRTTESLREAAIEGLGGKTRQMALRMQARYDVIKNAADIVTHIPPVVGLIRIQTHGGTTDPQTGTDQKEWKQQLESIFIAIMDAYPSFTQIRLIGLSDHCREIVRVNRTANGQLVPVATEGLQQKDDEPYMKKLAAGHREFFYDGVSFNREHGKISEPQVATLRAVSPAFTKGKKLFGAIIINVDFDKMQREMFAQIKPTRRAYLLNQSGAFIFYDPKVPNPTLDFAERHTKEKPAFMAQLIASSQNEGAITDSEYITYYVRLHVIKGVKSHYVAAAFQVPRDELLAHAHTIQRESLLLTLLLTIIAIILATIISRRLTQPLVDMTEAILSPSAQRWHFRLPVTQNDEIGDLARAFSDLTDALIQSEKRTTAILDNTVDGILSISHDGIIDQFNPACEQIFGYQATEVIGQNIKILVPPPHHDKHDGYLRDYLKNGESRIIGKGRQVRGRRKDGSLFYLDVAVNEYWLSDQPRFTAVLRDISDRIKIEETQRELVAALAHSNQELDQFAYVASHDLKAPLRVIDNASRWLEEDLGERLDEESRENMTLLRGRVRRMEKLLDDLLEYSRIGRKLDERSHEIVSGKQLSEDLRLLAPNPDQFTVTFSEDFDGLTLPLMPLQVILFNLISNAIKHHDKETGTIAISVEDFKTYYVFAVADDGPGIAPQYHEKIFQMFQTLQSRDRVEGSGMGLAIIKKHLEQHGETISLKSAEGEGCVFRFTWHKRPPAEDSAGTEPTDTAEKA